MKGILLKCYHHKKWVVIFIITLFITLLTIFKKERVFYLPFNIPGRQMAITIPPFGIFIESEYKSQGGGPGSVLSHERIHWKQFRKMGLLPFYFNYFVAYVQHGRGGKNWMERGAERESKRH